MKVINFKRVMLIFVLILFILNTTTCLAATVKNIYVFPSKQLADLSDLIGTHIAAKEYYIYRANAQNGFYYFQPKYLGTFTDGYYIAVDLKQINSDVYCYIQNNYNSDRMKQILLNYLKKNNYRYIQNKDEKLMAQFASETSALISAPPSSDFYFNTKKIYEDNSSYLASNIQTTTLVSNNQITPNKPVVITNHVQSNNIATQLKNVQPTISSFREISKAGTIFNQVNKGIVTIMSTGHGSGFLVDPSGLIVTNYHVVREHNDDLRVRFGPGEIVAAKIIETDPKNDIAVIWVNMKNIRNYSVLKIFTPPYNEPLVMVGEKVIAIGSPIQWETYEKTMTEGVVGKYDNQIIMHDASINHGNSGGPLINFGGYVVGINTFGLNTTDNNGLGGSISITNALPAIGMAKEKIQRLAMPPEELLPDIPAIPYSYEILKNAYFQFNTKTNQINSRRTPYIINSYYYDIAVITPSQQYRAIAYKDQQTLMKHEKRLNKIGEKVSNEEFESKNQASWAYNKPVVTVYITPKPYMTNGSIAKAILIAAADGMVAANGGYYQPTKANYSYEFKKDFDKLILVNQNIGKAYQAYLSGKEPMTKDAIEYFNYGTFNIIDKSYIGIYEYNSNIFNTLDKLTFQISSKDGKPPITVEIPQKIKNYIIEDFKPYWEYVESQHSF